MVPHWGPRLSPQTCRNLIATGSNDGTKIAANGATGASGLNLLSFFTRVHMDVIKDTLHAVIAQWWPK